MHEIMKRWKKRKKKEIYKNKKRGTERKKERK